MLSALQTLDPTRRHLVIAAYLHGESRHRLAEQYGVPVNTIKTWLRRALLHVRSQIEAMPPNDHDVGALMSAPSHERTNLRRRPRTRLASDDCYASGMVARADDAQGREACGPELMFTL